MKLTADSLLRWEQVGEKFTQADVRSDRATESRSRLLTGWRGKFSRRRVQLKKLRGKIFI